MSVTRFFAALVASVAIAAAAPALAAEKTGRYWETYKAPRLPDGTPDLQGIWTNASLTRLERAPGARSLVLSAEEAERLRAALAAEVENDAKPTDPNAPALAAGDADGVGGYNRFWIDTGETFATVKGEIRSSWIVDPPSGMVPYAPAARARLMQSLSRFRNYDGPEVRSAPERCTIGFGSTGGPPMLNVLYNNHYQITQSPEMVAILVEMNHNVRQIRINGTHRPAAMRAWLGDSIGRWEGDTLVVSTTHFHPEVGFRADVFHRVFIPPNAMVEERFTRIAEDEIFYEFKVTEPNTYSQPWRGEMILRKDPGPIYEYACHEGNYSLPNILAGARRQEADAAQARKN